MLEHLCRLFGLKARARRSRRLPDRPARLGLIEQLECRALLSGTTGDETAPVEPPASELEPPACVESSDPPQYSESSSDDPCQDADAPLVFELFVGETPEGGPTSSDQPTNSSGPAADATADGSDSATADDPEHIADTCRVVIFVTEDPNNPDAWDQAAEFARQEYERLLEGRCDTVEVIVEEVDHVSEVNDILDATDDIVVVVFIGHSGPNAIYVGADNEPDTNISDGGGPNDVEPGDVHWDRITHIDGMRQIIILGCNAGEGEDSVAQDIADASGEIVVASNVYINFDSDGRAFIRGFRVLLYGGRWITFYPSGDEE